MVLAWRGVPTHGIQRLTLVCDGENLGAAAPPPIQGAAAIARFLVNKAREWFSHGAEFQRTAFRDCLLSVMVRISAPLRHLPSKVPPRLLASSSTKRGNGSRMARSSNARHSETVSCL